MPIRQITIIGTGLIGGSFALALRKQKFAGRIVGCDRESALKKAKMRGVIDSGFIEPADAVRGSRARQPVGDVGDSGSSDRRFNSAARSRAARRNFAYRCWQYEGSRS
jgi:hypothetical protein